MFKQHFSSMANKWMIFAVLQLLSFYALAQYNLSGTITDEHGNSLPGASVVIKNTYLGAVTDVDGHYKFKNLRQGKYELEVSFLGYKTLKKELNLTASKQLDFKMEPATIMADEVIVQATRAGHKTPVAMSNLNRATIQQNNTGQDIPYQLSLMPSVVASSQTGTGIGYSDLRIRGTDPSRINVTVNGIPLNDSESQGVYWVNMPDFGSSVDNIQVQRGVGTSTNGAAAFGATVNFKTESINQKPYAEVQSVVGSSRLFDRELDKNWEFRSNNLIDFFRTNLNVFRNTIKVGTGLIKDKFSFDARYSTLNSEGYVDRSTADHQSLFLSGSYYTDKSLLKMNIIHGKQKTGITWWGVDSASIKSYGLTFNPAGAYEGENGEIQFYDNQTDNYIQTHYQLFYSYELSNHFYLNTAAHYTRGDGYYEQYKDNEVYTEYNLPNPIYGTDTLPSTNLIRQKKMANDFYGFTASLKYQGKRINAVLGGAWNKYDGDHFGNVIWAKNGGIPDNYEWYFNNGKKTDFNVYAKANYELNTHLNIFGDVQYRHINYDLTGIDDDFYEKDRNIRLDQNHQFNFFNPKAGVYYTLNNHNKMYASFSVAHREPTRTNFKNAKGDPNNYPKSERLFDYELGYNYTASKVAFGINLYFMDYKNQLVATGEKSSVGYDIMTNVDKSYRTGIELMAGVKILPSLKWDMNLTLSRNRINEFVAYASHYDTLTWNEIALGKTIRYTHISYSPEIIGASILSYEAVKNFHISLITKYVGEQYFDNTSSDDRKLDDYIVNNIRLQYTLKTKWFKSIGFSLQINNILGEKYANNAYGGIWYEGRQKGRWLDEKQDKNWAYYFPQAGPHFLAGITIKF